MRFSLSLEIRVSTKEMYLIALIMKLLCNDFKNLFIEIIIYVFTCFLAKLSINILEFPPPPLGLYFLNTINRF